MSLLHYIDNEVPAFGEFDSVVQSGGTIVQSGDAAFPERGSRGLRASGGMAYVQKDLTISVAPGDEIFFGWWRRIDTHPSVSYKARSIDLYNASQLVWLDFLTSNGTTVWYAFGDAGALSYTWTDVDGWAYFVLASLRATTNVASDGRYRIYVDGALMKEWAGVDNYDRLADITRLRMGQIESDAAFIGDFDEIKIATTYPEPFSPTPTDEYPQARRTVVLFRQASSDSREFADYCVSELGVPLANRCPLPNATANETLADYATFQTEVETDLAAWLALNPTVAANCSCFLLGHGVPGYFTHGGVKHSAVSRLMNYGTAFSSQTTNPLYNPATVARLTKAALGGKYLCTRIDADTLQYSKDILDRGLAVAGTATLPATDKLYSDESDYKASVACQHLRIITAALGTFSDDAFAWGDTGDPSFGAAGTRAVFVNDAVNSASLIRSGPGHCYSAMVNSYAAALGFSASAGSLVPGPFFEMLRIGGTLAEAVAVAVANLDYTAVAVGSPLMTAAFSTTGYNVYRGLGGIEGIDWEKPVAYLRADQDSIAFNQDLLPGRRYVYAVRAVSSAGVEECNTCVIIYVQTDDQGNLLPAPLSRPMDLTADVQQGSLLIGFSYYAPLGFAEADGFDVLGDNGTGQLDLDNPVATVARSQHDRFDFEVSIDSPDTSVLLAVRPRQDQRTGPMSEILFVPLSTAPAPAQIL